MKIFLSARLLTAISLAVQVHEKMKRKGDGLPYIVHPMAVFGLLTRWGAKEDTCIAGLLHDVLEDVPENEKCTYRSEIEQKFGSKVLNIVEGVTEQDKSLSWKERKESYLQHLREASNESLLVSCADKTHNVRALLTTYSKEGESVWSRFNAGRNEKMWFLKECWKIFRKNIDARYVQEFDNNFRLLSHLALPDFGAQQFSYYDNWREAYLTCPMCGWQGRIVHSQTEAYSDLFDFSCPECDKMLAIVSYPTLDKIRDAAKRGNADALAELNLRNVEISPD